MIKPVRIKKAVSQLNLVWCLIFSLSVFISAAQAQDNASSSSTQSAAQLDVDVYQFANEQQQALFKSLLEELRCPKCQNQNLMDSHSEIAVYMKERIHQMILEGQDRQQITGFLRQRYGDFISYKPPLNWQTILLWSLPVVLLLACLFVFFKIAAANRSQSKLANTHSKKDESARAQETRQRFADWQQTNNPDKNGDNQ